MSETNMQFGERYKQFHIIFYLDDLKGMSYVVIGT